MYLHSHHNQLFYQQNLIHQQQFQLIHQLQQIYNIEFQQSLNILQLNQWDLNKVLDDQYLQKSQSKHQRRSKNGKQTQYWGSAQNSTDISLSQMQDIQYFKVQQAHMKKQKEQEEKQKKLLESKTQEQKKEKEYKKDAEYFNNYKLLNDAFCFKIRTMEKQVVQFFNKNDQVSIIFKYVNGLLREYFETKHCEFDISTRSSYPALNSLKAMKNNRIVDVFEGSGQVLIVKQI